MNYLDVRRQPKWTVRLYGARERLLYTAYVQARDEAHAQDLGRRVGRMYRVKHIKRAAATLSTPEELGCVPLAEARKPDWTSRENSGW